MKKALLMVDLQNDFCEGGSLAVEGAESIIPLANALQGQFDLVIATQDWHPGNHVSFAINHLNKKIGDEIIVNGISQTLWPVHCVQESKGAAFHPRLNFKKINFIVHKGIDRTIDSYSAFFDNAHLRSTGLHDYLLSQQVTSIFILGLVTDYCVKYSALDAVKLGYQVSVIEDACRAVNLHVHDSDVAIQVMRDAGVHIIMSHDILKANR